MEYLEFQFAAAGCKAACFFRRQVRVPGQASGADLDSRLNDVTEMATELEVLAVSQVFVASVDARRGLWRVAGAKLSAVATREERQPIAN